MSDSGKDLPEATDDQGATIAQLADASGYSISVSGEQMVVTDGAPAPLTSGTFAIYSDNHGGYVFVAETEQHGVIRKHLPAAVVKLATGGGMISRKLSALFGE